VGGHPAQTPRLHDDYAGPTYIAGTAQFVLALFYIVTTFLSAHTTPPLAKVSTPRSVGKNVSRRSGVK
jgi:hypothetical protein